MFFSKSIYMYINACMDNYESNHMHTGDGGNWVALYCSLRCDGSHRGLGITIPDPKTGVFSYVRLNCNTSTLKRAHELKLCHVILSFSDLVISAAAWRYEYILLNPQFLRTYSHDGSLQRLLPFSFL